MRKLLTVVLLMYSLCIYAQERSVSGKITDQQDGSPLAGVSVTIKGTSTGTVTAADGTFRVTINSDASAIVFSHLNYESREVPIGNKSTFNVTLVSTTYAMSEVVVVAYGTQKRESITGSVSKIGAKQLESRLTTNISQALAGAAPGISATSGNG